MPAFLRIRPTGSSFHSGTSGRTALALVEVGVFVAICVVAGSTLIGVIGLLAGRLS